MIEKIKALLDIQNIDVEISKISNEFKEMPEKISFINNRIET